MATYNVNIADGGSACINVGDNMSVNNGLQNSQAVPVHSGPVTNCHKADFSYCARKKLDYEIQSIQKGKSQMLTGTFGVGKTSAALHFIEVNERRFAISWKIDFSNGENGVVDFLTDLAGRLGVGYRQLFQTIKQKAENENIIFLFDNVQEKPSWECFRELWNIKSSIYLIITTNNASLHLDFPADVAVLPVEKFDEALEFLEEIHDENSEKDLNELCDLFGWNILGLTAAKVYMLKTKISVRGYLKMLRDKEAAKKDREKEPNIRTLYASVQLCLEKIGNDELFAVSIISFISNNKIPEFLISNLLSSSNHLVNTVVLNNLQDQLMSLVHITKEYGVRLFSFHAFTQYVIRDMINESDKADLANKLVGIFVSYFSKDNRFRKADFFQRIMRVHVELFLQEWEPKLKDDRALIALSRLSELVGFTYTQQQPPLLHKLDHHFKRARELLHKVCGITNEDLQPAEGIINRIFGKLKAFNLGSLLENSSDREMYNITNNDEAVSGQLFQKLTKKSLELPLSIIEELAFSRSVSQQDLVLFPEDVKKNKTLENKINSSEPLSLDEMNVLVQHGAAYDVNAYRELFLPELYLSVIYSFGRNLFYQNRLTMEQPSFYINLLKLAYCLSLEINKCMKRDESVLHEYLVQSNGLLYLLVNDDHVSQDDKCIKKDHQVHGRDLKNAINRYQQLIDDKRRFFEMGMLKKTKDDKYSKLVCHQQILKCYEIFLSLDIIEDRDQYINEGVKHCDDLLQMLDRYVNEDVIVKKEDLVRYSRYLNTIAKFFLSMNREEYFSRVIEIFTKSAEHAEKYDVTLFHLEALVGLADVFSRIGKRRFYAARVSIRHLRQCNSKECLREMLRQKPQIQERIRKIREQNHATIVIHYIQLRRRPKRDKAKAIQHIGHDGFSTSTHSSNDKAIAIQHIGHDGACTSTYSTNAEECHDDQWVTHNKCDKVERKIPSEEITADTDNTMNEDFLKLAANIPGSWKKLAIFLGVNQNKIEEISLNHPSNVVWQAFLMLNYWWTNRDEVAQSWREKLGKALKEIGRNDLAQKFTGDVL